MTSFSVRFLLYFSCCKESALYTLQRKLSCIQILTFCQWQDFLIYAPTEAICTGKKCCWRAGPMSTAILQMHLCKFSSLPLPLSLSLSLSLSLVLFSPKAWRDFLLVWFNFKMPFFAFPPTLFHLHLTDFKEFHPNERICCSALF